MKQTKSVAAVVLLHLPGMALMGCIHWTWMVAVGMTMAAGILGGLIAAEVSMGPVLTVFGAPTAELAFRMDTDKSPATGLQEHVEV